MASVINKKAVFVTVDSASTKDIDDAILVAKTESGFQILVAIADPTAHIAPGSELDVKAREMVATIYARDWVKQSMLPRHVSQDLGSLVAGQKRSSFVFSITLDSELQVLSFEPAVHEITVAHRLSYEDIPVIADDPTHPLHQQIKESVVLAKALLDGRRDKGALALYDLKKFLLTDEEGNLLQMKSSEDTVGHVLVQEMMILTNSLFGQYLVKNNIPAIYRNHESTLAAPPTTELRETIEALLFASNSNKELATNKLQVLLGRAKYEAVANGHYGLNLPVYTHGTSPLRRYPDLVNLRQLKAHLAGEAFVYSQDELFGITEHLNIVLRERNDSSREHFKSVVSKQADQLLTSGELSKMDDTLLAMAIKNVRNGPGVNGLLASEISKRLKHGVVADTVIDRLFLEVDREVIEDGLAADMSAWLFKHPMKAMHLIMHGSATGYFSGVDFVNDTRGGQFVVKASLGLVSGESFEASGSAQKKKLAEQYALCAAILMARQLPVPAQAAATPSASDDQIKPTPAPTFNGKGALLELCSQQKLSTPTFKFDTQGPGHKLVFRCHGEIQHKGRTLTSKSPWAETKKGAESLAAQDLLEQIKIAGKSKEVSAAPALKISANPVGDLQEMTMQQSLPMPEYSFNHLSQTPPLFECQVSVSIGTGVTGSAKASSKAEAKKQAAMKALQSL